MEEQNIKNERKKEAWWQSALLMFARLSAWIAVPIIAAIFIGDWLDKKYHTEPWFFLGATAIAFIISIIGLVKNASEEYKKINKS
jgi:F0F1-type ATP synthase assembly protein I